MSVSKLLVLIDKYLNNNISELEMDVLEALLKEEANAQIFKKFIVEDYLLKTTNKEFDTNTAIKNTLRKIDQSSNRKTFSLPKFYRWAAVFAIPIASVLFWKNMPKQNKTTPYNETNVTIVLEDGTQKTINNNTNELLIGKNNDTIGLITNGVITYKNKVASNATNTLNIPYGKKSQLQLSDGTLVFLNAGSSITYPVSFTDKNIRQVSLKGEGFFEVAKNPNQPFVVNTGALAVEVLGTEFNVNTYADTNSIQTTLREGSVKVVANGTSMLMEPNEQVVMNTQNGSLNKEYVDVSRYTAWMNNELVFTSTSFQNIIKTLERTYDVSIVNNRKDINSEQFTARFFGESIDQIINYFSKSYGFDYEIDNNKITIN